MLVFCCRTAYTSSYDTIFLEIMSRTSPVDTARFCISVNLSARPPSIFTPASENCRSSVPLSTVADFTWPNARMSLDISTPIPADMSPSIPAVSRSLSVSILNAASCLVCVASSETWKGDLTARFSISRNIMSAFGASLIITARDF